MIDPRTTVRSYCAISNVHKERGKFPGSLFSNDNRSVLFACCRITLHSTKEHNSLRRRLVSSDVTCSLVVVWPLHVVLVGGDSVLANGSTPVTHDRDSDMTGIKWDFVNSGTACEQGVGKCLRFRRTAVISKYRVNFQVVH
jgi:hypothetical protein